ncbi:hypothetical protein ABW19_dt0201881 [Dactylella cylindrospora]|nr:hypothetical protein ABW19_dt0201881 [Dactylella cylindrospora]
MPYRPKRPRAKRQRTTEDSDDASHHHVADMVESPASSASVVIPPRAPGSAPSAAQPNDIGASTQPDPTTSSPTGSAEAASTTWSGPLIGYCFCQDWKITIKEPISGVVVCHCKDCQAISSSFFCTFLTVSMSSPIPLATGTSSLQARAA